MDKSIRDIEEERVKQELIDIKNLAQAIYLKRYEIATLLVKEMKIPSWGWTD